MALKQVEPTMETVGENKFYITPFAAFKAHCRCTRLYRLPPSLT